MTTKFTITSPAKADSQNLVTSDTNQTITGVKKIASPTILKQNNQLEGGQIDFSIADKASWLSPDDVVTQDVYNNFLRFYYYKNSTKDYRCPLSVDFENNLTAVTNLHVSGNALLDCQASGTEWHMLWYNGWCEQGGYLYLAGNTVGVVNTLTLPIPYKDNNYGIWMWAGVGNSGWQFANGVGLGVGGSAENSREAHVTSTNFIWFNATGIAGAPIYWRTAGFIR